MTLERGTLLHKRYRIIEILGQGGMGSVYRAVDENLGVDIALKENLFATDEYSRQFRLEAVILANLRHPNLPRVSDHFIVDDQSQYLVMDYIEGEDLRQRMERVGTITEEDAVLIGAAICDALAYLHTRKPPILHRDLKPGNIKITPDGHIFLVDFGLAKMVEGTRTTAAGARAITPGYSPPEQYRTPGRTDSRTDIYSLGATLYAALCGIIPKDGLERAMGNVQLVPLRKCNPMISNRLAIAIEKAMAIDPASRFQTAEDFQKALLGSAPIKLKVFICHAKEDKSAAKLLFNRLKKLGLSPWLDEKKLLPGQDWKLEIEKAVKGSDAIIICLSQNSVNKEGYVQKEITFALEIAQQKPEGTIYLIPLRLEECDVPHRLQHWQWVNYYDKDGYEQLINSLRWRAINIQQR
jgi:serine/threonine protein kinase